MHIKANSDTNIESGGMSNILGSEVHLNDGGSAVQATNGQPASTLLQNEIQEEELATPPFEYDFETGGAETDGQDPLTTQGERQGNPLTTKSIISKDALPTREPWEGHLTRDKERKTGDD
jgi:hypothetical protein